MSGSTSLDTYVHVFGANRNTLLCVCRERHIYRKVKLLRNFGRARGSNAGESFGRDSGTGDPSEDKVRIVLEGLRSEESIAALCQRDWIPSRPRDRDLILRYDSLVEIGGVALGTLEPRPHADADNLRLQ